MSTDPSRIILHYLEKSRCHRIVWLLEELNIEYDLRLYHKNPYDQSAIKDIFQVSPLGKSPILELQYQDKPKLILFESGHIINYLIDHYDNDLKPITEEGIIKHDYFTFLIESSISENITFILALKNFQSGLNDSSDVQEYIKVFNKGYNFRQLELKLDELEVQLSSGSNYLIEDKLTSVDILLSFYTHIIFDTDLVDISKDRYPYLSKWWGNTLKQDGLIKANKRVLLEGDNKYPVWFD
ncbi:Glutathione S-transferase 3 [Wickerhamomyces ciferrii]|uniref:Glutathione S-transferase 3 n=1 Tax=Wickerhamomyces ciferrii (strain ATCC 14091 / BCRC 22168 / CBS 111 / JCM 3599 / NBRC 0793 / NRRL Y-1031 F-60-10) TaxID=1206466 RepID=K0KPP6_WICCF|nr:Glutathione S-transferase 3 [Wickerhamomyces ciferrii]CCH43138.1 Glutathione S-transferase 3 [Wickerhamomyces ciferrii]